MLQKTDYRVCLYCRFALRLLLHNVPGPIGYNELRTYNNVRYDTFHEAAMRRGLLEDDTAWQRMLQEAAGYQTGRQLRQLFVTLLLFKQPTEPHVRWHNNREALCDDLLREAQRNVRTPFT